MNTGVSFIKKPVRLICIFFGSGFYKGENMTLATTATNQKIKDVLAVVRPPTDP